MRAVVQRVSKSRVTVDSKTVGAIERGLVVLLGVEKNDSLADVSYMANKILGLRVFEDEAEKMNRSVLDVGGSLLIVSQFTLLGDVRKGKRPSFIDAAGPELGKELYGALVQQCREVTTVETGQFQAMMQVELVNDGPVTILLDSNKQF